MRLLTGDDVSSVLRQLSSSQAKELLNTFSHGLASYSKQKHQDDSRIIQPQRVVFQNADGNTVLTMPVSDGKTAVKAVTVPLKGDIAGAITLFSAAGELEGVLNAAEITAFRTALATMTILTRWPAPEKPKVCVFGSGKQAEWHVRLALLLIPDIAQVTVINRSEKRLRAFEKNVFSDLKASHPKVAFHAFAKESNSDYGQIMGEALAGADIISCCTPSTEPLFTSEQLRVNSKPRFLSLIGSYKPGMHEVDRETLGLSLDSGKIWVDLKDACLEEAGELIAAELEEDDLEEVGDFFARDKSGEEKLPAGRELTVFKCVGFGYMDLVISRALLQIAQDSSKGTVLERF